MKATSRLLTLLLALTLVFTLMPATARAEEMVPEMGITLESVPFQVNPLYEGIVSEEDFDLPEPPEIDPTQIATHAVTYETIEAAGKQVRTNMKNRTESFTVYVKAESSNAQTVGDQMVAVALEHTGTATEGDYLMWQYGGWKASVGRQWNSTNQYYEYTYTFTVAYYTTAAQEKEVSTAVTNLINSLGVKNKSDYEKICAVYDWICANVTYDYANLEDTTYVLKHTAYAALIDKTAVCQGYALLFYRLMLELGVDNRLIAGLSVDVDGNLVAHGWNIVLLGDYYYSVDSTWDAGYEEYDFFLTNTWNFYNHYRYLDYETWEFHEEYPMAAEDYDPNVAAQIDPYIYAGTCSEEVYWMLLRDGSLVILGSGEIPNATTDSTDLDPQWEYWLEHITTVVVDEGITRIGDYAFYQMPGLTAVAIAPSVTEIGQYAFNNCPALAEVILSEGLTAIGQYAFGNCVSIAELELPESLTSIGKHAFWHLEGLTTLKLPSGLTEIGQSAFACCYALKEVNFPDSLTCIGESMFSACSALETVHLPANLVTIESSAFYNCIALKNVEFPDSLKTINGSAFAFCKSLESVVLPAQLETLGNGAFLGCRGMKSITFPENVTLGMNVLDQCASLETVILPEGITEIPQEMFARCSALKTVVIPESVTVIQGYAFNECTALESIDLPDNLTSIGRYAFTKCTSLNSIVIPETVTELGEGAFNNCTSLKSANLPKNLNAIGEYTFYRSPLEGIVIPAGVKSIGLNAFRGAMITELIIPEGVEVIDQNAFAVCENLTKVELPDTLKSLSGFGWCPNLTSVSIPENVVRIGVNAFAGCTGLVSIDLPDTVTWVDGSAFEGCTGLKTVKLSKNLADIGMDAFADCTALETLMIPANVERLGYRAFSGCTLLKEIRFQGDSPVFEYNTFSGVTATAYYPEGNETWTEDVLGSYGGTITWVPYENDCTEHSYEAVVTDPTCQAQGYTTYTCTICGYSYVDDYTDPIDHVYEDGHCKWCGAGEQYVKFSTYTTSLGGNIAMNFYVELSEDLLADPNAYMQFTFAGRTVKVPLSEGKEDVKNGVTVYMYACPITSKNMSDEITAQVVNIWGKVGESKTMAVDTYCNWIIANYSDEKTINLMKAMLNYGASAQMLFDYNTDDLANAALAEEDKILTAVDASDFQHTRTGEEEGIKASSYTLLLDSETTVRCYFELTGDKIIDQFTFTVDGVEVEPQYKDGRYYIEKKNIAAHRLDDMHVFTCGGIEIRYGGLSYVNQVMTYYTEGTTFDMAVALYLYSQASEAYIAK